jgi:hypothetical protein
MILAETSQGLPVDASPRREMVVIIRPSFMKFCLDGCRAAVFNHILYWIARKAKDQPRDKVQNGEVTWYATTEEITEDLAHAWGVCKVRKEVNALIEMGVLGRSQNQAWRADRTKHFFFGKEYCARLLSLCREQQICLLHIGLPDEITHLIDVSNANDESIKCSCPERGANDRSIESIRSIHQMQTMDLSNGNDTSIGAITQNSTKVTTKVSTKEIPKTESSTTPTGVADATTPTVSSLDSTPSSEKQEQKQQEAQPQGKPEMPSDEMAWGPEKMVRLTECLRFCRGEQGAFFSRASTGKSGKSQRDRQLVAARKILSEIPQLTEVEYVAAFAVQNNEWWNREKGSLTVEDMAANTPRKVMRTVELLEKVRTRSQSIKRPPTVSPVETKPTSSVSPLTHDEACQMAQDAISAAKALGRDIQVQAVSLENGAWGIVVRWNTQYFEKPETMKSVKRWESALSEMTKIWDIENRERMKRATNG